MLLAGACGGALAFESSLAVASLTGGQGQFCQWLDLGQSTRSPADAGDSGTSPSETAGTGWATLWTDVIHADTSI